MRAARRWASSFPARFAPGSLRFQLLARTLVVVAGLLLAIGSLQYVIMKDFVYDNEAETLKARMAAFPREWLDGGSRRGPRLVLPDVSIAAYIGGGRYLDLSEDEGWLPPPRLDDEAYDAMLERFRLRDYVDYRVVRAADGTEQLVVFRPVGGPNSSPVGLVQLGTSTAPLKDMLRRQLLTFAGLSALALAGGVALYWSVLRRTLQPLNRTVAALERTNAGTLNERLPTGQGQREIDRLAESFNGMLERLARSFEAERDAKERMRRFVADASHELRTPLTSIHGFLEVLLRGAAEQPEQLDKALRSMLGESRRIAKLVEDLLLLAKMDRTPQLRRSTVRLDRLLEEMEPQLRLLAGNRVVSFDVADGVSASVDADRIKQVVLNLFHNAVQHTDPDGGSIRVELAAAEGTVDIVVRDNGVGIAEEHLPRIFERFYRVDASRARKHGGAGLGLSIAHAIVAAHGGTIEARSKLGEGAAFRVALPAVERERLV